MIESEPRPIQTTPYGSPIHNYGDSSIIALTSIDEELHKAELVFRSQIEGRNGEIIRVGSPLMNNWGVTRILGIMQGTISRVTIMSNLESSDINKLILMLNDALCKDLMVNKRRYEIEENTARDLIHYTAISQSYIILKRALKEGERRFWKGSQQEIHTRVDQPERKNSILSKLWTK